MKQLIFLFIAAVFCSFETVMAQVAAFPGAEGGGMYTTGGRGGKVYYVNTLEDNLDGDVNLNEGSLRWCLNQDGPRTILFQSGGTIRLKSRLVIDKGDLTIAGQSAPGGGITLAGFPVSIRANNVIVRFVRVRMGDRDISKAEADGADAFSGGKNKDIIIDHCSISWGTDECSSFYDNKNFTMQWCIISESLRLSGHSKGAHGYGAIWGGVQASFHHNLLAHHDSRTPRLGPGAMYAGHDTTDMRNNVIYNWSGNGAYGGEAMHVNMVNNYFKAGPATGERIKDRIVALNAKTESRPFPSIKGVWGRYYISGNVLPHNVRVSNDNWEGVKIEGEQSKITIKSAYPIPLHAPIHTQDARTAYRKVLAYAGSSLNRDDIDRRIIEETRTGTARFTGKSKYNGQGGSWKSLNYPLKGIIDSQEDLNPDPEVKTWEPWPSLDPGIAVADGNRDGIPDGWIEQHHPNKSANDMSEEGYTYLEVYLNSLIEQITKSQQ
ncbi:pectate lyase [Arcticibacter pallidicorallinus]|uniref:Pectate lyase n=1 Tax=Arcticibacter pallidicorallinus TaxID=1259464 RepID=A0A2T0U5Q2_9SPHI|nr:pectate lyase [Arcticibacter pallidicorallinus]PRY53222.1 pectate lyase [Arcticibacter pallidicorallinus]